MTKVIFLSLPGLPEKDRKELEDKINKQIGNSKCHVFSKPFEVTEVQI